MDQQDKYIEALIMLHSGLKRQGPGDEAFSDFILKQLPSLPEHPRIADIGCGAGGGALFLARKLRSKVKAVDFAADFLSQMMVSAEKEGLAAFIEPVECDMATLNWEAESIDLLWSEGAVYNIGFARALSAWRPFMAKDGVLVFSEMSYFLDDPPEPVKAYMSKLYPAIKTESDNVNLIESAGYEMLGVHRLPSSAWWKNYYHPLLENMMIYKQSADAVMQEVIKDTEEEMNFFRHYHRDYGYTFYLFRFSKS